ncbi:MAG: ribonuclease H [Bacteroidetes bacterium GWF2_43_63]|nr:MAG: ribonuclease H [Bacteroidetes bacterium GWE2_42_42]OFY53777.1 MAG: ribonuclease H [Bacteroidetes bacterium GWF2_43_63]HCB61062.1 ribonuclease H [Bacteroidales bacterium]HCY24184.1 ribonuclease H [Bacteroidales bacterium]
MSKNKNNFYVVWVGHAPGIYSNWDKCRAQISGFAGAKYKGFITRQEAEKAYECGYEEIIKPRKQKIIDPSLRPQELCICVDAACSGNPGVMEYQGVWGQNGDLIFREGPFKDATNNIGEFIALVHGLSWLKKNNLNIPLYSDSRTAMAWLRNKKAKTKLERTPNNSKVFQLLHRAEAWLMENPVHNEVRKWETDLWGEIPADFGRK